MRYDFPIKFFEANALNFYELLDRILERTFLFFFEKSLMEFFFRIEKKNDEKNSKLLPLMNAEHSFYLL